MKKTLLLLLLLPFVGLAQSYTGTIHVGAAQQAPFKKITTAISALSASGVSGSVTLVLDDAAYNNATGETFPIVVNNIPGVSASKTVTIRPKMGVNVRIEASNATNTGIPAIFLFKGADYVTIDGASIPGATTKNLTINNMNTATNNVSRSVIWVASVGSEASTNITIKNTTLKQSYATAAGNLCAGVYSGAFTTGNTITTAVSTANNNNLQVINNTFVNLKQGVFVNAGTTATTNVVVKENDMGTETNGEKLIMGVHLNNAQTFTIADNVIYNVYRNSSNSDLRVGGILIEGNSNNGQILRNRLTELTKTHANSFHFAGIVLNCNNAYSNIDLINNVVSNVTGTASGNAAYNGHGIALIAGKGFKLYNNTVKLERNQTGGYTAALFVENGVSNIDARNNIFANLQTNTNTRRTAITIKKSNDNNGVTPIFTFLNFNDYYSLDRIGFLGSDTDWNMNPQYRTTLSQWKAATTQDTKSVSINPNFVSATDLHLTATNTALDNLGTPLLSVVTDMDGQVRNLITPDLGADEFGVNIADLTPGTSNAGIYCTSSTTWNGLVWSNGLPSAEKDAIFTGDYTQIGGTFTSCSLTVKGSAKVLFTANSNAVVVHNVNVATSASLIFESNCNLLQVENTPNEGNITIKRFGSRLKKLDYTFWSSPVTGSQTLQSFSPATMANRFYTYSTATNTYQSVASIATTTFQAGKGYLIRMPNQIEGPLATAYNTGMYRFAFEGVFTGKPTNGDVTVPLSFVDKDHAYNSVGNPYPSPISITDFIDANINNIEGTIWFWRKTNNPTETSYSTATRFGFVANSAPGGGGGNNDGNDLIGNPFSIDPEGVINTGQGFIVKAKNSQNLVFRNNMRKFNNFSNFFRDGETDTEEESNAVDASRIWLNVSNAASDVFAQTLVGYTSQATVEYDNGIDGRGFTDGTVSLYSIIENEKLAIQGRPAFDVNDVVALGFKTEAAGDFIIKLDNFDGLFTTGVDIFIKDNETGLVHDIRNGDYTFSSEAGSFESRFEIVYQNQALSTSPVEAVVENVIVYKQGQQIVVKSPEEIKSVTVYDITGKTIFYGNNVNSLEFTSAAITASQQVVVVYTELKNGSTVSKKVIFN